MVGGLVVMRSFFCGFFEGGRVVVEELDFGFVFGRKEEVKKDKGG